MKTLKLLNYERDRWIAGASLVLHTLLRWLYLEVAADAMQAMTGEGGSSTLVRAPTVRS